MPADEEIRRWIIFIHPLAEQSETVVTRSHEQVATLETKSPLPDRMASHFDLKINHHAIALECYP